jgi:hypothetical protein
VQPPGLGLSHRSHLQASEEEGHQRRRVKKVGMDRVGEVSGRELMVFIIELRLVTQALSPPFFCHFEGHFQSNVTLLRSEKGTSSISFMQSLGAQMDVYRKYKKSQIYPLDQYQNVPEKKKKNDSCQQSLPLNTSLSPHP